MPSAPTRSPNGVATQQGGTLFGNYSFPFPFDQTGTIGIDFVQASDYVASDWVVTTTSGSSAVTAGNGGILVQTTAASSSDIQFNALTPAPFVITAGYPAWFGIRCKSADIVDPSFMFGLVAVGSGAAMTSTDGIYFTKAAGASVLVLNISNSSTTTTVACPGTLVNNTFFTAGFYYDGNSNGQIAAFNTAGNTEPNLSAKAYKAVGGYRVGWTNTLTNLPTAALTLGFGVKADASSARTLTTDWIFAAVDSSRN